MINKCMFFSHIDAIDDEDVFVDEAINDENNDEEHFQVQPTEDKSNFILVNTRIDYQYRSNKLNNTCLYDFVSTFYKKKINETDLRGPLPFPGFLRNGKAKLLETFKVDRSRVVEQKF